MDSTLGRVVVFETVGHTQVGEVVGGATPVSIAVESNGLQAVVVNQGSNDISVIDIASNTVTATIPVGAKPTSAAFADPRFVRPPGRLPVVWFRMGLCPGW